MNQKKVMALEIARRLEQRGLIDAAAHWYALANQVSVSLADSPPTPSGLQNPADAPWQRSKARPNLRHENKANRCNSNQEKIMSNSSSKRRTTMNAKYRVLWISLFVIALFAGLSVTKAQTGAKADADVVTAISNLENDAVKANLAGDPAFYQKVLAEDWTRGDSDGTYYTKAELLKLMADPKNFKTNSEKLSELKVRVYGNTAVATYKDTYDILIRGEHRAHTIIATDTFVKMGSAWMQVASHGSEAK